MRILSLSTDGSIFTPLSAARERMIAYARMFDAFDIIVFSRKTQKYAPALLVDGAHAYPTASRSRLFYGLDAFRVARRLSKPDVVTVQDPFETGLIGLFIARWYGVPLHVQVHTDFLAPEFSGHSLTNRIRIYIAGYVVRRATRIRVVSQRIKGSIERTYHPSAPITVLPIFVDVVRLRTARTGELARQFVQFRRKLLIVARLEKEKNVHLAIASFAATAPDDACLIILGDGRERRHLEKQVLSLGLSSRVFFEGQKDPFPYYALADLVLVPSRYEGYGLVIIEALAAGKPVLATDVGVAREAGAIVASEADFPRMLASWFAEGMREGKLLQYPYETFEQYVAVWAKDVTDTAVSH